jgi:hypothetical protein
MARLTQARIDKAVKAVMAACGGVQIVIAPDGTVRVLPASPETAPRVDKKAPVDL